MRESNIPLFCGFKCQFIHHLSSFIIIYHHLSIIYHRLLSFIIIYHHLSIIYHHLSIIYHRPIKSIEFRQTAALRSPMLREALLPLAPRGVPSVEVAQSWRGEATKPPFWNYTDDYLVVEFPFEIES